MSTRPPSTKPSHCRYFFYNCRNSLQSPIKCYGTCPIRYRMLKRIFHNMSRANLRQCFSKSYL